MFCEIKIGSQVVAMKVANSLKTLKTRDRNCRVVRRKGRVYVINKTNPNPIVDHVKARNAALDAFKTIKKS